MTSITFAENGFTDLDICVYHLIFLANSIERTFKGFTSIINKTQDEDEKALFVSTCSLVTIQTVSFLEEFKRFKVPAEDELHGEVLSMRKALKPAIKGLEEWSELREFRNSVLAHNLRSQSDAYNSVFQRGLDSYDAPKNGHDFAVVISCVSIVKQAVEHRFKVQLNRLEAFVKAHRKPSIPARYQSAEAMSTAINNISEQITTLLRGDSANRASGHG